MARQRFSRLSSQKNQAYLCRWPVVAVAALLTVWLLMATPLDRFWGQVWDSRVRSAVHRRGGIAQEVAAAPVPNNQTISVTDQIRREYVAFADATTLSRLAGIFQAKGKKYTMRIGSSTTFADLRDGPVVLVGGFNNGWTMRVLSSSAMVSTAIQ